MKKLLFIDNDGGEKTEQDVKRVQRKLSQVSGVNRADIEKIEIIQDFSHKDRDKMMNKLFSGEYIILSWSMYTVSHFNSMGQIRSFLRAAGSADLKGLVYIDGSGEFEQSFTRSFDDIREGTRHILSAIERNYILRFKDGNIVRLLPSFFGDTYASIFKTEEVDLIKIIS